MSPAPGAMPVLKVDADLYDCSSAIVSFGKARRWSSALAVLEEMPQRRLWPNAVVCNSAITAVGTAQHTWATLSELLDRAGQVAEGGAERPEVIAYNSAMSSFSKVTRWAQSLASFEALRIHGRQPDSWSFVALLGTVEQRGNAAWSLAVECLEQMHSRRVEAEVMTLTAAMGLCEWQQVLALLKQMRKLSISANIVTSTSAMAACARGSQWPKALDFFTELQGKSQRPTEVTLGALATACEKGQQWKAALQLKHSAPVINVVVLNSVLASMRSSGRWRSGLELLGAPGADTVSFSSVSSICERLRQWEAALQLNILMRRKQVEADSGSWNMLISASGRGAVWETSLQMARSLVLRRVWPTMITTAATIGAAGAGKAWPQALQCLDASLPHGQELLSSALFACEVAQRWTGALQIMEVISLRGHEPDMVRCSSVVSACQGQWLLALELLHQLGAPKDMGLITYAACISACAASLQWLKCLQVLDQMRVCEIEIDVILACDVASTVLQSGHHLPGLLDEVRSSLRSSTTATVSLATALQQSENVLPCLNIVQMQIRPTVEESPARCDAWKRS
ncbi:unnamed protein product [Durusdinium trenchii]|uniref:Pentatricopeptide repeat-containing protein, chloroplastic n=1 Tax=Durusdinium trenchii TaxID=1381693 RepID=A0ABP0N315_9DINO